MNLDQFKKQYKFLMLALDHRGSFKKLINPDNPDGVSHEQAIDLKREIIKSVENQFSSLLIDLDWGLPAYDRSKPYLLPIEKSGFAGEETDKINEIQYSFRTLLEKGAKGAKLLLYFNPRQKSTDKQLKTAKLALEDSQKYQLPLFLEIVTFDIERGDAPRSELVLASLKMFLDNGIKPDVYKLEYPGDVESCREITDLLGNLPWILLTRGDSFDHFKVQFQDAVQAGAQGFLAGRALWQEVCGLQGEEKQKFLEETLPERFKIISEIATKT